jgi:large subunit ribosomal protein L5
MTITLKDMTELETKYNKEVKPKLMADFDIKNTMAAPTVTKIVVNAGIGKEYQNNTNVVEEMSETLSLITGQKPVVNNSRIAISNFKLREGTPNGLKVTLRGDRMWDFLYKLVGVTLPRIKDFRGVSRKAFDRKGNYALGIKDHTIFPEIDTSTLVKIRSLQIVVNTSARNNEEGLALLEALGMPFERLKGKQNQA